MPVAEIVADDAILGVLDHKFLMLAVQTMEHDDLELALVRIPHRTFDLEHGEEDAPLVCPVIPAFPARGLREVVLKRLVALKVSLHFSISCNDSGHLDDFTLLIDEELFGILDLDQGLLVLF